MNKLLIATMLTLSSVAYAADAPNYLHYQLNSTVVVTISSAGCSFPQLKEKYPLAVAAFRVDGKKLPGCYRKFNEDLIEIQWYKGDTTVIPANAFLLQPKAATQVPDATM